MLATGTCTKCTAIKLIERTVICVVHSLSLTPLILPEKYKTSVRSRTADGLSDRNFVFCTGQFSKLIAVSERWVNKWHKCFAFLPRRMISQCTTITNCRLQQYWNYEAKFRNGWQFWPSKWNTVLRTAVGKTRCIFLRFREPNARVYFAATRFWKQMCTRPKVVAPRPAPVHVLKQKRCKLILSKTNDDRRRVWTRVKKSEYP